jgi:hypothetical protein
MDMHFMLLIKDFSFFEITFYLSKGWVKVFTRSEYPAPFGLASMHILYEALHHKTRSQSEFTDFGSKQFSVKMGDG